MAGTHRGGLKTSDTINIRYPGHYERMGRKGGLISRGGGFNNHDIAVEAGRKGGAASRRGKSEFNTIPCRFCNRLYKTHDSRNSHVSRIHADMLMEV